MTKASAALVVLLPLLSGCPGLPADSQPGFADRPAVASPGAEYIIAIHPLHNPKRLFEGADRLVVFQETALFPWMTTVANVAYGPIVQRQRPHDAIRSDAMALLETVGLLEFKDKYPIQLSGGMQRRAELARAMINNPAVMMLDEPFRGLDAMTRELMQEYFLRLYEDRRQTVLFVTSEIDEAIFLADALLIMSNRPGRITKTMAIELPRPRQPKVLTSTLYLRYKEEAMEMLHAEALKAFAGGSQAALDFVEAYAARDKDEGGGAAG